MAYASIVRTIRLRERRGFRGTVAVLSQTHRKTGVPKAVLGRPAG